MAHHGPSPAPSQSLGSRTSSLKAQFVLEFQEIGFLEDYLYDSAKAVAQGKDMGCFWAVPSPRAFTDLPGGKEQKPARDQ